MSAVVLKVNNLTKNYSEKTVVRDLSFHISEGEIFGLLGANGAGKTTALKMITGLCKMDKGEVFICEKSLKKHLEKALLNVGGIIDFPQLYENFSGQENLEYYASLYKNIPKTRIEQVVETVRLQDKIKAKVRTYSLGMKQRLGIAQAILHRPKLLILDEPTNGLDPEGIVQMRKFLKQIALKEQIAILISSHNLAEMELMCNTIAILNDGNLEKTYKINQLKEEKEKVSIKVNFPNFAGRLILSHFKNVSCQILKNTITLELPPDNVPQLTSLLVTNGINIYSISAIKQTLEDVFLETINKKTIKSLDELSTQKKHTFLFKRRKK